MPDDSFLTIRCANAEEILSCINGIMPSVPKEVRKPFNRIKLGLLSDYGKQGLYERTNNRSVEVILEEYAATYSNPDNVIAQGQIEGVKYTLTEKKSDEQYG